MQYSTTLMSPWAGLGPSLHLSPNQGNVVLSEQAIFGCFIWHSWVLHRLFVRSKLFSKFVVFYWLSFCKCTSNNNLIYIYFFKSLIPQKSSSYLCFRSPWHYLQGWLDVKKLFKKNTPILTYWLVGVLFVSCLFVCNGCWNGCYIYITR